MLKSIEKQVTLIGILLMSMFSYGQTDTIFSGNEVICCNVKEITADAVKYAYPGEDVINTAYKNIINKIVFKNGRIQTFAESLTLKKIESVDDYDNVNLSQIESEVKGLHKLGEVSSKAKGTTELSNQERVKQRAYKKMKIMAALMGANVILLTNHASHGVTAWKDAETTLAGVAYTNQLPDFNEFMKLYGHNKKFIEIERISLWSGGSDMKKVETNNIFLVDKITNENGFIVINDGVNTKYPECRVVSFDQTGFNVFYKDKSTSYNIRMTIVAN